MGKNLIIGFGSSILSDQAIVPNLVEKLEACYIEKIDFASELINSLDLIGLFEGYENLLILDVVQDTDIEIGAVKYYPVSEYKPSLHLENFHDSSLIETLETAKMIGIKMPEKIGIVTINTKEVYTISTRYSHELDRKFPEIVQQIKVLISYFFQLKKEETLFV